jgi:hypothetical protein
MIATQKRTTAALLTRAAHNVNGQSTVLAINSPLPSTGQMNSHGWLNYLRSQERLTAEKQLEKPSQQ